MVTAKLQGWRFGVFEADLELHELRKHGIHIKLAGQPFQVLALLLQQPNEVVSRERLRSTLWPGEPWGDHDQRLNKAINKIREALNDSADTPRLIETIPRIGYRFLGSVIALSGTDASNATNAGAVPAPVGELPEPAQVIAPPIAPSVASAHMASRAPRSRVAAWIAGAVLAIPLGGFGLYYRAAIHSRTAANEDRSASGSQATPLTTYVGSEQYPAFSPDGGRIAFAWDGPSQNGLHLYITSSSGRELHQVTKGPSNDYAPVWSPDASALAFVRGSAGHSKELWIVSANGSSERKVVDLGHISRDDHPGTWTKDPHSLIVAARPPGEGPGALYVISSETGERRRLTSPPMQSAGDLSPSISPDGTQVAFTRGDTVARRDIFLARLTGDLAQASEPVRVTDLQRVIDTVAWSADGRQLYFSASPTPSGARHIFRTAVNTDGVNHDVVETGVEGIHPVISPDGHRLCYVRSNIEQTSIWRLDLTGGPESVPKSSRLLSSTRRDYTADLSPEGQRLVFSSVRSGASEIWVSNTDGSNLKQITSQGASTPRWSPDGHRIVYESSAAGQPDIYVFDLNSSVEKRLTRDPGSDLRPSWSRDGKFIYFSSARTGRAQIWKVSSEGGTELQITRDGGVYAVESFDAKTIYYTSSSQPPSIRSAPASGGTERTLVQNVVGHSAISLGRGGLYYLSSMSFSGARIDFYGFAEGTSRPVVSIDHPVHHFLSSSLDGQSVLFTQIDHQDTDLMLLRLK